MRYGLPLLAVALAAAPASAYDTVHFLDPVALTDAAKPVAAAAANSRFYVLDAKKSALLIYDAAGKLMKSVGRAGSDASGLSGPRGLAVAGGKVYIADTGNNRIQILDLDGNFLSSFGAKGAEAGALRDPQSVAVGVDGRVFVADTGNNRVQIFTPDGILLTQFGVSGKEPGQFRSPARVSVDPSDNVYVLDKGNGRIQKFDPQAKFIKEMNLLGDDFALDDFGFLYILDTGAGKIIEQGPDGFILGRFGSKGNGAGQFKRPESIAVADDGRIIVVDAGQQKLAQVEIANKLKAEPLPHNTQTKIFASGPSRVWNVAASAVSPKGEELYAYLPEEGLFVVLDEEGKETRRFGTKNGKGAFVTKAANGFAVSAKHGLYVSDGGASRLQRFTVDGTWKANYAESSGMFDSKKKEGRLKTPQGVAINDQGTVYVADTGNRRVDAFSPEGVFLFSIGPKVGEYELQEPVALAWDSKARFIYFVDKGLKRVFKCEPSGALIASWGEPGAGPGQFESPEALAFDGQAYLYVLDRGLKRVSVYGKDGRWMTDLLSGGSGERNLGDPASLAVQGQRLVIADRARKKIVSFDLHPSLAAPASVSTTTREGIVNLSWSEVSDPWTKRYRVYRSTQPGGPYAEVAKSDDTKAEDPKVKAYEKYWYRVATEAKTGDVGPKGPPMEVVVAGAFNKAPVEISTVTLADLFPANYKWYLKNPVGQATLTNNVNLPFQNVKFSFRLKDFMDFSYDTEIKRLDAQQSVDVPLIATLNNKILEVTEETPIQAEFTLTYFESGKQQTISVTKPMRVHSRNAITWQDPSRVANFITPNDTPVFDFQRALLHSAPKSAQADALNPNLVRALNLWDGASEAGVKFFESPTNSFETVSADPAYPIDLTQFPRETLQRKSGECDDLTTFLISMMEAANVKAAIVDYPGHMALMVDTEAESPEEAGLPDSMLVQHNGTYWVPIEPTLIGKPFSESVRKAAHAYKTEAEKGKVRVISVRDAWATYEPATMPAADWKAELPPSDAVAKRFGAEVRELFDESYQFQKKSYEAKLKEDPKFVDGRLRLGLLEWSAGKKEAAVEQFNKALAVDPKNAAALNNLGNVSFLSGDMAAAEANYLKSVDAEPNDSDVWLNLVKTAVKQNDRKKASEYAKKAVAADPEVQPAVDTLVKTLF